jgi:hypothetical protein
MFAVTFFLGRSFVLILTKNGLGYAGMYILGDFFTKSSGHQYPKGEFGDLPNVSYRTAEICLPTVFVEPRQGDPSLTKASFLTRVRPYGGELCPLGCLPLSLRGANTFTST